MMISNVKNSLLMIFCFCFCTTKVGAEEESKTSSIALCMTGIGLLSNCNKDNIAALTNGITTFFQTKNNEEKAKLIITAFQQAQENPKVACSAVINFAIPYGLSWLVHQEFVQNNIMQPTVNFINDWSQKKSPESEDNKVIIVNGPKEQPNIATKLITLESANAAVITFASAVIGWTINGYLFPAPSIPSQPPPQNSPLSPPSLVPNAPLSPNLQSLSGNSPASVDSQNQDQTNQRPTTSADLEHKTNEELLNSIELRTNVLKSRNNKNTDSKNYSTFYLS